MDKVLMSISIIMIGMLVCAQQPAATPAQPAADKPATTQPSEVPAVQQLPMTKSGTVQVVRDSSGKVVGINLVVTSYKVAMNDVAKQLEAMDGQKVRVRGTVSLDGDQRVITLQSIEAVPSAGATTSTAK